MLRMTIHDIKTFMAHLLSKDLFDSYELVEASVKMNFSYHIDGHINKDFFDPEEEEGQREFCLWKDARPHLFQIIKGRRLPLAMKIVLRFPPGTRELLFREVPSSVDPAHVEGLYLNILYHQKAVTCTTGVSYKTFVMDKSLDQALDQYAKKLLEPYA